MDILETVFKLLGDNLPLIITSLVGLVGGWIYKDKANKDDAIASLKSGVAKFFQEHPHVKATLADGKITKEEWADIFRVVGPVAVEAATKGGAKVLKRWIDKESVANKYIEAVARQLSVEFADRSAEK